MTDDPLDPEEEARVRALLGDLGRAPEAAAMPPEVAARLEETLAGLVAQREDPDVVPLRRRWARRGTTAAAAVIVLGAGGVAAASLGAFGDHVPGRGGSDSATSRAAGGDAGGESLTGSATAAPSQSGASSRLPGVPTRVSSARFAADAARIVQRLPALDQDTARQRETDQPAVPGTKSLGACPGPPVTDGSLLVPVRYDGTRAVLVIHPARAGRQLVEAWTCAGHRELDSATVPSGADGPGLGSPHPTP